MRASPLLVLPALLLLAAPDSQARQSAGAPESFTANLQAQGAKGGALAATIQIAIRRYTPDPDRVAVENALKTGGYPGFLTALRQAPHVGDVSFGETKWAIRWARERPTGTASRQIVVVTDQPIFFVGGGGADAKPRAGYEVAVIEMVVDNVGLGKGTMTAAARVKPGGETGVLIEDYAEKPIQLTTVSRNLK